MSAHEVNEAAAKLAREKPWFFADEDSVWLAWGDYPNGAGTFSECWAMVVPAFATGGPLLFKLIGPLLHDQPMFGPDNIRHAVEYKLVPTREEGNRG